MRVQGSTSVAANGTSGNVISGKILEFVTRPSLCKFFAAASAAGITAQVTSGPDVVLESGSVVSQANRFPIDPDDVLARDVAGPGERLNMTFSNTTAGALTVYWAVEVTPIA